MRINRVYLACRRRQQGPARAPAACAPAVPCPTSLPACTSTLQYGWSGSLAHLDADAQEVFQEAYSSDPSWAAKGPALVRAPQLAGGRLVIELSSVKEAPKAVENFRCLCTGEKGTGKASGKLLHYKGVPLHRVQKGGGRAGGAGQRWRWRGPQRESAGWLCFGALSSSESVQ